MEKREFDLVLQGATGFTGRLAAEELALRAPQGLRWAIAGRSQERLEPLARKLKVPWIVADGLDQASVDALAAKTRVVLSCAGPFALHGTLLVDACVQHGTHYADITGELPWIRRLIERHHATCFHQGTTLVPASGFDSVPADLGVHALVRELQHPVPITGFFTLRGGLNGGTLHSGLALAESQDPRIPQHSHLLDPDPDSARAAAIPAPVRTPVFPVPGLGRWAAPFLMAPVNERVVRRSAALLSERDESYGNGFRYDEFLLVRSRLHAHGMSAVLGLTLRMMASSSGRRLLRWLGPKPGHGPSERSIREGFARLTLVVGPLDNPSVIRKWIWEGDPSNRITVHSLVQTGLALAAGEARCGGVLTPASAFGPRLLERLQEIGAVQPQ